MNGLRSGKTEMDYAHSPVSNSRKLRWTGPSKHANLGRSDELLDGTRHMTELDPRENVGSAYDEKLWLQAQSRGWDVLRTAASQFKPGMFEADAQAILKNVMKELGAEKAWHPSWTRFGPNTRLGYGKPSDKTVQLRENDVFFLDIGPVFLGHESDVGETFVVGNDPAMKKLVADSKNVFNVVREHFFKTRVSGAELYRFAQEYAQSLGWKMTLEGASGHRIGDFPHSVHHRGALDKFDKTPTPSRWILEIHLHDEERNIGAFYEDVL